MRLLYCKECQDLIKLKPAISVCSCGETTGSITSDNFAEFDGPAIPVAIDNKTFYKAIGERKNSGKGINFLAFVVSKKTNTFKQMINGNR